MKISERQLRNIIMQEVKRSKLVSEAGPTADPKKLGLPSNYPMGQGGGRAADAAGVVKWQDPDFAYSWNPKTGEVFTSKRGDPSKALTIKVDPQKQKQAYDSITAQGRNQEQQTQNLATNTEIPGCNLASLRAGTLKQLNMILRNQVAALFATQILFDPVLPATTLQMIKAGQQIANMGQTVPTSLTGLLMKGADKMAGPLNEMVGATLIFWGNVRLGIEKAMKDFAEGGPGIRCSFKVFASAVGKAFSDALSRSYNAIVSGYGGLKNFATGVSVDIIQTLLTPFLGPYANPVATVIVAMITGGITFLNQLPGGVVTAIMAAGTATTQVAVNESQRKKALDNLALEICTISYVGRLIKENVKPENRGLVLL